MEKLEREKAVGNTLTGKSFLSCIVRFHSSPWTQGPVARSHMRSLEKSETDPISVNGTGHGFLALIVKICFHPVSYSRVPERAYFPR